HFCHIYPQTDKGRKVYTIYSATKGSRTYSVQKTISITCSYKPPISATVGGIKKAQHVLGSICHLRYYTSFLDGHYFGFLFGYQSIYHFGVLASQDLHLLFCPLYIVF